MELDLTNSLKVSSLSHSLQNEGMTAGCPAFIINLAGCNLLCDGQWQCDTFHLWKHGERIIFDGIIEEFDNLTDGRFFEILEEGAHLVFTGGEPMMQQQSIILFMEHVFYKNDRPHPFLEIETNGTIRPSSKLLGMANLWSLSPKLQSSGALEHRYDAGVLNWFHQNIGPLDIQWKFVVINWADAHEIIDHYVNIFGIKAKNIILIAASPDSDGLIKSEVIAICKRYSFRYGSRVMSEVNIEL